MNAKVDSRRILIFLAIAYGIAWITALVIALTGGIANSPKLTSGTSLALVLMAVPYMWAPAIAAILTRLLTHEPWHSVGLRPRFAKGWPFWIMGWVLPTVMTIIGAVIFFLIFPQYFDPNLTTLQIEMASSPTLAKYGPWAVVGIETLIATLVSPILNSLATFGEEFGWRGYLLPKLLPLGWKKTSLLIGLIWGVWHWPLIFLGYEYGFKYWGAPWVGPLLFVWITFSFGVFLAWIDIRAGSVWPSVIGHAGINGLASLAVLVLTGSPNVLLGPLPVGLIGSLGFSLVALALLFFPGKHVTSTLDAPREDPSVINIY